jgi:hypothetical protein
MSIKHIPAHFIPSAPVVEPTTGTPTVAHGRAFMQAMHQRTGGGTGIVPQVTPQTSLLKATGTGMNDALGLTQDWNHVGTVPAGTGVQIAPELALQAGNDIWVFNNGANNLNVFPPDGQTQIDALAVGDPFVLAPGKSRCFQCLATSGGGQNGIFSSYGN